MSQENIPFNLDEYGLFVGLSAVPVYPNNLQVKRIKDDVIDKTFSSYAQELNKLIVDLGSTNLHKCLYKPISFYAIGYFNLITVSLIDDYHFGNFSFRPLIRINSILITRY